MYVYIAVYKHLNCIHVCKYVEKYSLSSCLYKGKSLGEERGENGKRVVHVHVHACKINVYMYVHINHIPETLHVCHNFILKGETNRTIAEHSLNKRSSRSHCIFTISVEVSFTVMTEWVRPVYTCVTGQSERKEFTVFRTH